MQPLAQLPEIDQPIDIVVIDDNADDLKWITRMAMDLRHHCNMHTVQDSERLESALLDYDPSIVFVDYNLGDHTGIDLVQQFHRHFPDVAFVLITGLGNEKIVLDAIRAGASDYIAKDDLNPELVDELIERVLQNIYRHNYARLAITILNEGIVTTDASRRIIRCNPAFEVMVNKDEAEIIGQPLDEFFHPDDEDVVRTLFSLSDSLWDSQPELRLLSESDEAIVTIVVNGMVAARNKNYLVIINEVFNSNERIKSIDKQLAIIDASPDFIGYSSSEGEIQFLNPSAKALLGIEDLDENERITLLDLFSPVMRRSFATHIFSALARKGQFIGNGLVDGRYRKRVPVSIVMNGLTSPEGNLSTITFILREITPPAI